MAAVLLLDDVQCCLWHDGLQDLVDVDAELDRVPQALLYRNDLQVMTQLEQSYAVAALLGRQSLGMQRVERLLVNALMRRELLVEDLAVYERQQPADQF